MDQGFKDRLLARMGELGLSFRRLAEKARVDQATVHKWSKGQTYPRRGTLPLVARALQTSEVWLLNGNLDDKGVAIVGRIIAGGIAVDLSGKVEYAQFPPDRHASHHMVAYTVGDASNQPVYRPGDVVYVDLSDADLDALLGEDCLVTLADGRRVLRALQPGEKAGTYTLHAHGGGDMRMMEVESAARVAWVLRKRR